MKGPTTDLRHPLSGKIMGSGDSTWAIPKDAKLGQYNAYLVPKQKDGPRIRRRKFLTCKNFAFL